MIYRCDNSTYSHTLQSIICVAFTKRTRSNSKINSAQFPLESHLCKWSGSCQPHCGGLGAPLPPWWQQWHRCLVLLSFASLSLHPLPFQPFTSIWVMNTKHRGEAHELGQEDVINNLDKYGDGLERIKERVGGKEVEAINRPDLLLPW